MDIGSLHLHLHPLHIVCMPIAISSAANPTLQILSVIWPLGTPELGRLSLVWGMVLSPVFVPLHLNTADLTVCPPPFFRHGGLPSKTDNQGSNCKVS